MLDSLPVLKKQLQKIQNNINFQKYDNKIEKYQKKLLELLIRQKTTILQNESMKKQVQNIQQKIFLRQKQQKQLYSQMSIKQSENKRLRKQIQNAEETIQNLQTQNKMLNIAKINEQEKYSELQNQMNSLKITQSQLEKRIQNYVKQDLNYENQIREISLKNSLDVQNLQKKIQVFNQEKFKETNELYNQISKLKNQLQNQKKIFSSTKQSFQFELASAKAIQSNLNQKIIQLSQQLNEKSSRINEQEKQIHLSKLKNKQLENNCHSIQIQKGQQEIQINKIDKEIKKLKKDLTQYQDKCNELQEEKQQLEIKLDQMQKNYKNTKKQLQKLKNQLYEFDQDQKGSQNRIDKLDQIIKVTKSQLTEKQQFNQKLEEKIKQLNSELSTMKNQCIQLKYSSEQNKKKYEVVSETKTILQEKMVLQREQTAKNIANMIKQKDICYRQNHKLLQLLEFKDKVIDKIFNGLKNEAELENTLNLQLISKDNHSKKIIDEIVNKDIKTAKERILVIDHYLQKNIV